MAASSPLLVSGFQVGYHSDLLFQKSRGAKSLVSLQGLPVGLCHVSLKYATPPTATFMIRKNWNDTLHVNILLVLYRKVYEHWSEKQFVNKTSTIMYIPSRNRALPLWCTVEPVNTSYLRDNCTFKTGWNTLITHPVAVLHSCLAKRLH